MVQRHLASFLRHTAEAYDKPLPAYVEPELHASAVLGALARVFVKAISFRNAASHWRTGSPFRSTTPSMTIELDAEQTMPFGTPCLPRVEVTDGSHRVEPPRV